MALSVSFALADCLKDALHSMKHDGKYRALLAVIDQESIKLVKAFDQSESIGADLEVVRKAITDDKIEACFVVVRIAEKEFGQVLMVPDTVKPKIRMLYASSSAHLRNASGLPIGSDTHATKVDDLTPAIFNQTEEETRSMMTEKEKIREKMDAMPLAPAPSAMAGVGCPLSEGAKKAGESFSTGDFRAATFTVGPAGIDIEKSFPKDASTSDIIEGVPADQPRYIVLSWEGKTLLVYVCPPGTKPKERMPYASSKASFISQIGNVGVKFDRRIETDEVKNLEEAIAEALQDVDFKDLPDTAAPPKAHMMQKGPRMLI